MISSETPSEKNAISVSTERLSNGSTASTGSAGGDGRRRSAQREQARVGGASLRDEALHVGEKRQPRLVVRIALPVRELRRLRQLKHDRALARLDHAGYQRLVAVGQRGLGADPAAIDRSLRPENDDGLRLAQRRFGHLVVGLACPQADIPPDVEALRRSNASAKTLARA